MDLYMTTSTDGGDTWSVNERITTVSSDPTAGKKTAFTSLPREAFPIKTERPHILAGRAGLLGEYIGVTASTVDDVHPMWTDTRLGDQDAFTGYEIVQGIEEETVGLPQTVQFSLYPEPVSSYLDIAYVMPHRQTITFNLYDICGRNILHEFVLAASKNGRHRLDLGTVPGGTYFLHIETGTASKFYSVHKVE
jgi:hypothetical protein